MVACVCLRIYIEKQQAPNINVSKHPLRPTSTNLNINTSIHTSNNIKCSIPPHINRCMGIPMHVSGLFISLWEPANSLFVRDKYVTPTGKRLYAGYVQKAEARETTYVDTTARSKHHVRVVQWRLTTYI